ncbi:MAG: helix-turn-helix domain-containing protein [Sphingomonadaceae bacterium]
MHITNSLNEHELATGLVSLHLNVSVLALVSRRRDFRLIRARMLYVWLLRERASGLSYPVIGRWLGERNHSSIIHLHRLALELRTNDRQFRALCEVAGEAFMRLQQAQQQEAGHDC